eukprot:snap_masked-scaffold_3-processed-gene-1.39-mRNA-1 protein AED:1.00 eAED:1.00 QI:0/-1/0/0/-1/1/1/0/92
MGAAKDKLIDLEHDIRKINPEIEVPLVELITTSVNCNVITQAENQTSHDYIFYIQEQDGNHTLDHWCYFEDKKPSIDVNGIIKEFESDVKTG